MINDDVTDKNLVPGKVKWILKVVSPVNVNAVKVPTISFPSSWNNCKLLLPVNKLASSPIKFTDIAIIVLAEIDEGLEDNVILVKRFVIDKDVLESERILLDVAVIINVPDDRIRRFDRVSCPFVVDPDAVPDIIPVEDKAIDIE